MNAAGPFEVEMHPEPPFDELEGVTLGRARVDKTFGGGLVATSVVHMLSARTKVPNSAGYVALERVSGTLDGKRGSFVLQHSASMTRGTPTLSIHVVADSGTDQLRGISGSMAITIDGRRHSYVFEYELDSSAE